MQRANLDAVAQLFERASDNVDEGKWAQRFQEHVAQAMRRHSLNLRKGGSAMEQRLELLRARFELNGIVADRLESRAKRLDPSLAEALHELRAANAIIIEEAFQAKLHLQPQSAEAQEELSPNRVAPVSPRTPPTIKSNLELSQLQSPGGLLSNSTPWELPTPLAGPASGSTQNLRTQGQGYAVIHNVKRNKQRCFVAGVGRPGKELTLRQLRDIIGLVYAAKVESNNRLADMNEPQETMEQHLYSFLGKRYGLKSVIEEWARAIFKAIQRFAPTECDIAVFGKILQNSVAESFAEVQETLRSTVQSLLRNRVQERHPQRPQSEFEAMWREWLNCGVPLSECETVVNFMYNENDSAEVLVRLHAANSTGVDTDTVRYRDLIQILLSFQLQLTENYLADFVQIFRNVDVDDDGIVNGSQLREIAAQLAIAPEESSFSTNMGPMKAALNEAHTAVQAAIQYRRCATFSECVDLFTGMVSARKMVSGEETDAADGGATEEVATDIVDS